MEFDVLCKVHHPTICMQRASSYNMYALGIILQYVCTAHHPTICMHRASSYNMYMNQQDAQNSFYNTLFSIRFSTCFGLR
jgi:hypothetical protein